MGATSGEHSPQDSEIIFPEQWGELNPLAHEDSVNPLNTSIDMSANAGVPQGGDNAGGVPLLGNILLRIVVLCFMSKWVN